MSDRWQQAPDGYSFRFFTAEQVDQILRDAARKGRAGSHQAIERIRKLESGIERAALWRRIRQLKFPPNKARYSRSAWTAEDDRLLYDGYQKGWSGKRHAVRELIRRHPDWQPHVIWKRAAKLRLAGRPPQRGQERSRLPWSEHDHDLLLNLAGYKTPRVIAKLLHRSEAAVRYHLLILGESSRVHLEGFSRQELAADLHLGKKTIQRLIVEGLLEVRDPRITRDSLDDLRASGRFNLSLRGLDAREPEPISVTPSGPTQSIDTTLAVSKRSRAERVWAETARSLGIPIETVKALIAQRLLKLYDPTITDHPFRLARERARSSQMPVIRRHRPDLVVARHIMFASLLNSASSGHRDSSSESASGGSPIEPKNNGLNQEVKAFQSMKLSTASETTPQPGPSCRGAR